MRRTYSNIKEKAKSRMSGHFGDIALIVFIPVLIGQGVNMILQEAINYVPDLAGAIIFMFLTTVVSFATAFMSIKLLIPFLRGKNGIEFGDFFKFDKRFLSFIAYSLITTVLSLLAFIPMIPTFYNLFTNVSIMSDPELLIEYFESAEFIASLFTNLFVSFILLIVIAILLVRFQFTTHIIIHKNMTVIDAMKKSFEITKGSFFRVLFFPLSFILWFFLIIITCGIAAIYVTPYMAVATGYLYFTLLEENGDSVGFIKINSVDNAFVTKDPLDPLDSIEDIQDEDEDYYV